MSVFCEALLAMNMTLFGFCADDAPKEGINLPDNERSAWELDVPAPAKPVVIPAPVPAPPPPVATPVIEKPKSEPVFPPVKIVVEPEPERKSFVEKLRVAPPKEPDGDPAFRAAYIADFGKIRTASKNDAVFQDFEVVAKVAVSPSPTPKLDTSGLAGISSAVSYPVERRYDWGSAESSYPVDNCRIVASDRYVSGILETGFNSSVNYGDSGGLIIQTDRDIYGYNCRNILVPKGSRLICDYQSPEEVGESRIEINCKRILMAGTREQILIASTVGDVQGRAGVSGEVDNRFWEKYGDAFLLTGLSTGLRVGTTIFRQQTDDSLAAQALDYGAIEASTRMGQIMADVLDENLKLEPIITISQGTRIVIRPSKDWYLKEVN